MERSTSEGKRPATKLDYGSWRGRTAPAGERSPHTDWVPILNGLNMRHRQIDPQTDRERSAHTDWVPILHGLKIRHRQIDP